MAKGAWGPWGPPPGGPKGWKGGGKYGPPGFAGMAAKGGWGGSAWGAAEPWNGEVAGAVASGQVFWISVGDNALTQQGFPPDGAAMVYEKGPNIFSSSAFVLGDIVGDISTEVEIVHDADWEQYPDIGQVVQQATGEEHCFAVAVCASQAKWGIGLASGHKGRENAAKLALAVSLASDNPAVAGKLASSYPEFGAILRKQGVSVACGGSGALGGKG